MANRLTSSHLKGIGLVCAAAFVFAVADVTGKHLFAIYSVMHVAAVRYGVNLLLLMAILWPANRAKLWRTQRLDHVMLRGLCLVFATLTMSLALRLMPVGETVSILHLSPFLVMLLAGPLLGEKVSPAMWVGAVISFSGVIMIARPGGGLNPAGVALMLVNALLATAYHLSTRALARTETTIAMLFHSALIGLVIFGAWTLATFSSFHPTLPDLALMILLGALSAAGHFLFTAAYREAPASLLAPVNYLHLVWAALLGAAVFGHVPDGFTLLGMGLIAGSGICLALYLHLRTPK